jgi:hypothetical protein
MSTENKEASPRVETYKQRETNKAKAVEANGELQKEERESELLGVNPEDVLEEEERMQPQSQE